jgi:hypothetical protein
MWRCPAWDVDDLDEGMSAFGEQSLSPPLRLHRRTPGTSDRISAVVFPYLDPDGSHAISLPDPSESFDMGTYILNLVGRWFATDAIDLGYVTNPDGHHCLEDSSCVFEAPPED